MPKGPGVADLKAGLAVCFFLKKNCLNIYFYFRFNNTNVIVCCFFGNSLLGSI